MIYQGIALLTFTDICRLAYAVQEITNAIKKYGISKLM
jgi:hypothetical protein